jgi:hypothetical protein
MTKLHDKARDIYHNCETSDEIVEKIEHMLVLESRNATLLAALKAIMPYLYYGIDKARRREKAVRAAYDAIGANQ